MKKVLFVGEHPSSQVGNGNMMAAVLAQVNTAKYQVACFCARDVDPISFVFNLLPFTVVNATTDTDFWGNERLISLLTRLDVDIVCFVGIDIWQYQRAWKQIVELRDRKKFKIVYIFPFDIQQVRMDWLKWINDCDVPCVYSQYGERMLKDHVPALRYFRPPLWNKDLFKPLPNRAQLRRTIFSSIPEGNLLLGFVGKNQLRKSPERLIKAFMAAKQENPNMTLYLHTDMQGVHNLTQMAKDFGAKTGDLVTKTAGTYPAEKMAEIYNAMDCLINCSIQEGLSWTPIEAMLCGTPCILSDTTAQTEIGLGAAEMVPCNDLTFIPMVAESGQTAIEGKACRVQDISRAILKVAGDPTYRAELAEKGIARAKEWLEVVNNINDVLDATAKIKPKPKIQKVLFAQHSSAGDVLMTTQCFKGIKARHPNMKLVCMTQEIYRDIIVGNPYVDEYVDWDERKLKKYQIVYNPHGEHILHGGFNNLDVSLYSMYPYFCKVEADEIAIAMVDPEIGLPDEYIVVHTTGGSKMYRSYPHMDVALKGIGIPIVQLGGPSDIRCKSDLDLCGKLGWRESAWVMAGARAAVVVDSFLSHLAGAVGTNAVILYGPAPARVVGPRAQYNAKIINLQPDMLAVCKIMSHCWGNNPQCQSPCIHTISPAKVKKALEELLNG